MHSFEQPLVAFGATVGALSENMKYDHDKNIISVRPRHQYKLRGFSACMNQNYVHIYRFTTTKCTITPLP